MIDWSQAPEGAEFCVNGSFYKFGAHREMLFFQPTCGWVSSACQSLTVLKHQDGYCERPQEWPTDEQRIGSNGPSDAIPPANKYDRTIIGKYGTGSCIVDVYRVLNAFGPLSPEIDHAVKKLLAPGTRGAKSERQDLLEAIQSIEARLQYLEARDGS